MRSRILLWTVLGLSAASLATGAVVWIQGVPTAPEDAVSREFSFSAGFGGTRDAVSREFSFNTGYTRDIVSREFSFASGPDLAFDLAGTFIPAEGNADQLFQVTWRVENVGVQVANGPWQDRIEFDTSIRTDAGTPVTFVNADAPLVLPPGGYYERTLSFLMPPTPTPFSVRLLADSGNALAESTNLNNLVDWQSVTVLDIPRPNLRASVTAQPSATPTAGTPVALSFLIWNDGAAPTPAPQWFDRVYLVPDVDDDGVPPASESGSVSVWSFQNLLFLDNDPGGDGSVPGTSYERAALVLDLPLTAVGPHFLAVRADASLSQYEVDEGDNLVFSSVFDILDPPRPDLETTNIALSGAIHGTQLLSGSFQTVTWDVFNRGTATFAGGGVGCEVWLSTGQVIAGASALTGDLRLESSSVQVPQLGVGQSAPLALEVFLPADLADLPAGGPYFFKVLLDPLDGVNEEESIGVEPYWNNLAVDDGSYPVLQSSTPDLDPSAVGLASGQGPASVAFPLQIEWTVDNGQAAGWDVPITWRDELWLSRGNAVLGDPEDHLLGTFYESTVQENGVWTVPASYSKSTTVIVPETLVADSYTLILVTDAGDAVFEFNSSHDAEGNNQQASTPFSIARDPANLVIEAQAAAGNLSPPTSGAPGDALLLPWTVTNAAGGGTTSASSWTDRFYLSPSATDLVGAYQLLSHNHSGALAPGAKYEEFANATVPFVAAGPWFLHFVTDVGGAVFEDLTADNTAVEPFQVTADVADLVVDQIAAAQLMRPGDPVAVAWTVRNAGPAPSGTSFWYDTVFLADVADLSQASEVFTLGSVHRSAALGAGSAYDAAGNFNLPQGLTPGAWWVVVVTDASAQVFELDDDNNSRATRTVLEIEPPPPGGGGGPGTGWLPSNLVAQNLQVLNGPVTAGQVVQLSWDVVNQGTGITDLSYWEDRLYLSLDGELEPNSDIALGQRAHTDYLDVGESRAMSASLIVPLSANGAWVVIVDSDAQNNVFQDGAIADDVTVSASLLQVDAPPLSNLAVSDVALPASVLLGEALDFSWTTLNDSGGDIPAGWGWSDSFWLVPDGQSFPSLAARYLGQLPSNAGLIASLGGTHVQNSAATLPALVIPGLMPGPYRLVVLSDTQLQIAETEEGDNAHTSLGTVDLQAIELASGGAAMADIAAGESRWFRLSAPADQTIDLEFAHQDPDAACELFVREVSPPNLGSYDLASEGVGAVDPFLQSVRIPRTSGADYYVLARTVSGAGVVIAAQLDALQRPFEVDAVVPPVVGAGAVTIALEGSELWRASAVEVQEQGTGTPIATALELALLEDGTLLARFDLFGVTPDSVQVVAIDGQASVSAIWSGALVIEAARPLAQRTELEIQPTIRLGESGAGLLRLTNVGNVDIPFAAAAIGHLRPGAATDPLERLVISSPDTGVEEIESDGLRDSWALSIEDLAPGRSHEIPIELAAGANFAVDEAAVAVVGIPHTVASLMTGPFTALSDALRLAVASDPQTPSQLTGVAQDPVAWDALVDAALVAGFITLDQGSLHLPGAAPRSTRDLLIELAAGIEQQLALPAGVSVPATAIDLVAATQGCSPFSSVAFDCELLAPAECGGGVASVGVTTQEGGNVPSAVACVGTPVPDDPNEKIKPKGVGPNNLITPSQHVEYEVHFENQASATAWASRVEIVDELEPGFVSSSVFFRELRVGETLLTFPNVPSIAETFLLELDQETTVLCQVTALVDAGSDTILVTLQALDPTTGLPSSDASTGLLPPSAPATQRAASGYVAFSVLPGGLAGPGPPLPDQAPVSGQRRRNTARIRFNTNSALTTNTTENTLDAAAPTSNLAVDSAIGDEVELSWSADDTEDLEAGPFPGAGVNAYSLYVRAPGQTSWSPLATDTADLSFSFVAQAGGPHEFKLEASDLVGNVEDKPNADLVVNVPFDCNDNGVPDDLDIQGGTSQDCDASGVPDECELADGTLTDANTNGVPDVCECLTSNFCGATPNSGGSPAQIAGVGLPSLSGNGFAIQVSGLLPGKPGLLFYSGGQQQVALGDGLLCLTSPVIRLPPIKLASPQGTVTRALDFTEPPFDSGPYSISAGSTWYFQYWYRDPLLPGGTGFNLSDGLAVTFCD